MKLSGSWISMLMGCLLILVTGLVFVISLINDRVKEVSQSDVPTFSIESEDATTTKIPSRVSSRKASKVSANLSMNSFHQTFDGLHETKDIEDGTCSNHSDEPEHEYTIPDVDEMLASYEQLTDPNNGENGKGDFSIGKLSDFSSEPLPMSSIDQNDTGLTNHNRSTSFENMLYADNMIHQTEIKVTE